jgi:hypothetical protein
MAGRQASEKNYNPIKFFVDFGSSTYWFKIYAGCDIFPYRKFWQNRGALNIAVLGRYIVSSKSQ